MNLLLPTGIIIPVVWLLGVIFFRSFDRLVIALIIGVIILISWLLRSVPGLF